MAYRLVVVLIFSLLSEGFSYSDLNIECPFPDGQVGVTQQKCESFTACAYTGGVCHMADDAISGYTTMSDKVDSGRGFTVSLQKANPSATMFGTDIQDLVFEVIYHEDYHVQIKIYDPSNSRYEVPVPLNFPTEAGTNPAYQVAVSPNGSPFSFAVTRTATGTPIYQSLGAISFEDQFIQLTTSLASSYLYGFGENSHTSFKHSFTPRATSAIFARDESVGNSYANQYGSHPYYMVMEDDSGNSHSLYFHNSNAMEYSTFLLSDGTPALSLRTIGGIIDLHIYLGPMPEDLNMQYATTIGKPLFPQYWTMGFHLSRWGYNSTTKVREVRDRMRAYGIPQDCQTFDIDYMDRRLDFTIDPVNFGDLALLIQELHDENMKATLILDPAIATDWGVYDVVESGKASDAFIKWMDPGLVPPDQEPENLDYIVGYVWPENKTVFPDFMKPSAKLWWEAELVRLHSTLNYDAIWIDMNEPANFGTNLNKPWNWPEGQPEWSLKCPNNTLEDPPYPTLASIMVENESKRISDKTICMSAVQTDGTITYLHYDVHSLYGYYETVATWDGLQFMFPAGREVVLSRSTVPGSGVYTMHWLGDNYADWTNMQMSIIGMLEFNMFGIPMVGADICGFMNEPTEEMCARWMELGAFYPFSRNHNGLGFADQDPAAWPLVAQISRDVLLLRYKYVPYLYGLFHRAHMNGRSVSRPLLNVFPTDVSARDIDDQFFWGDALMIAPVLTEGATSRSVYFPDSIWYDLVTGQLAALGPLTAVVAAPIEKIPVYLRGGRAIPFQEPSLTLTESRGNPFGLTIALDANGEATGEIFWDDGVEDHVMSDAYLSLVSFVGGVLTTTSMHATTPVAGMQLETIQFYGYPSNPTNINVNGTPLISTSWSYDVVTSILTITFSFPLDVDLVMVIT